MSTNQHSGTSPAKFITMAEVRRNPGYSLLLSDLELSTRLANHCNNQNILYIAELVSWTEDSLRDIWAFGPNCMAEVKEVLEKLGLSLNTCISHARPDLRTKLRKINAEAHGGVKFSALLSVPQYSFLIWELPLSDRVQNICNNHHLVYVADLAQKTEAEFLEYLNSGKRSTNEVKSMFARAGLSFGTKIIDPPDPEAYVAELEEARTGHLKKVPKLQQLAADRRLDRNDFIEAARDLLTPAIINKIPEERKHTVFSERFKTPAAAFVTIASRIDSCAQRAQQLYCESVDDLRKAIRQEMWCVPK